MAKLTAPLLSFGARGKLADTLVYFPWKGIAAVRSYVIPANPNSAAQQTQRGFFSDAVDGWHNAGLTADDKSAWNRAASVIGRAMSGFNAYVRAHIAANVPGDNFPTIFNVESTDNGSGSFDVEGDQAGNATATVNLLWGYSPSSLINTETVNSVANHFTFSAVTGAPFSTVYYKIFYPLASGYTGESGIYSIHLGA